jgi:hypothetical protein
MMIDIENLFKLRAAVGRYGEMDAAGWWNTQGVLGPRGTALYKRGLPRTHLFARVRLVTNVARVRSATIYPAPGIATLWSLPAMLERSLAFEERGWTANGKPADEWADFEGRLAPPPEEDLAGWLASLGLGNPAVNQDVEKLELAPGGKGVEVSGPLDNASIQLLAAAHSRGSPRNLVVPFIPGGLEAAE